jgi:hypothetical protein
MNSFGFRFDPALGRTDVAQAREVAGPGDLGP